MNKKIEETWKNTNLDLNALFDEQRRIEKQLIAIRNLIDCNNEICKKHKKVNDLIKNCKLVEEW